MKTSGRTSDGALEEEIRAWWKQVQADANALVDATASRSLPGGRDIWDGMPVVDSKAVTETSPIFEPHLGIPLDPRDIRPGGYSDVDDMISDLVPKMRKRAQSKVAKSKEKQERG